MCKKIKQKLVIFLNVWTILYTNCLKVSPQQDAIKFKMQHKWRKRLLNNSQIAPHKLLIHQCSWTSTQDWRTLQIHLTEGHYCCKLSINFHIEQFGRLAQIILCRVPGSWAFPLVMIGQEQSHTWEMKGSLEPAGSLEVLGAVGDLKQSEGRGTAGSLEGRNGPAPRSRLAHFPILHPSCSPKELSKTWRLPPLQAVENNCAIHKRASLSKKPSMHYTIWHE